jgi:hypothetical protein
MKTGFQLKGKYRIITTDSITGEVLKTSDWIENLIMLGTNTGVNLLLGRLANVLTYDCIITSAEIGTGTTAPANSDTALVTPTVTGIAVASSAVSSGSILLTFFIPSGSLSNGTYNEFLLRCGTQAFARSIISPAYTKGTNQDTTIEYTISGTNS